MKQDYRISVKWLPLIIAVVFVAGMWVGPVFFGSKSNGPSTDKLETILSVIRDSYVDEVDVDSLLEETYPELLAHLDPHSVYIPKSELQSQNDELRGAFSGIGISFSLLNDTITVLEVISGGPSEKVGLLAGDRIVTINDSVAAGKKWTNERVMTSLRGDKGTSVKLGIKRNNSPKLLTFNVVRGDIPVASVDASYIASPGVGYLRINKFGATTYDEFLQSITELREKGAQKYIIDLRGNTGGFMEPAVLMANEFLSPGSTIVSMRGRVTSNDNTIYADGTGAFMEEDLVVLMDEYSASASEIFAGAIQDNDRGCIIGRRSFGKGLVQNQIELPDSSAIRLTVARYYTPSGRCIQKSYTPGDNDSYANELLDRMSHGELYNADSIRADRSLIFKTVGGRTVFGGGGIIPDVFVANDSTGINSYYISVANAGLLQRFAFNYVDRNRTKLSMAHTTSQLLKLLPSDAVLLDDFTRFAESNGIPPRPYYINLSAATIVSQLKALIARDVLSQGAFYEIFNATDPTVMRAIMELNSPSTLK